MSGESSWGIDSANHLAYTGVTMPVDPRPTVASPDDDPYLWLEEIDGDDALAWVAQQNKATLSRFGGHTYQSERETLREILDRPDNLPVIARRGPHIYNYWKDATNPRGLWRRATLPEFRTDHPRWEVVLDLDDLARRENEDWIWSGPTTLPDSHDRAIISLSRGGGDAVVLREFDIAAKTFIAGGFAVPEAKGDIAWIDNNTVLLSSAFGDGMATASGYCRTVRLWQRGVEIGDAPVIFETDHASVHAIGAIDRTSPDPQIWFLERPGFFETTVWFGDRSGAKQKLDLPDDAWKSFQRGWLAVKTRTPWTVGETTHGADTVLGIGLDAYIAGDRDFSVLFETAERVVLRNFFWCGGRLVLSILDDLNPVFEVWTPAPGEWQRSQLPNVPKLSKFGVVHVWSMDVEASESNGDLLVHAQDPITPPAMMMIEANAAPLVLKQAPAVFRTAGLEVSRHEAISIDGERIPYTQIGPPGATGDAPVHLSGYGGFQIARLPEYRPAIGKLWLEPGGTAVVAHIRGGGEFGSRWHEAGRLAGKRTSHDDFAAVAADLVTRGVTRPERIAAEGGSNGGILITNMLARYPERFGALFCTIPLIDMRRFTKLHAGASWIDEYGDPDKADDWAFLQTYSAYHLAAPGQSYPPILLATSRKDDRVHPGHARKMAAKLAAMGYVAHFYEPAAGGHGYGKDNEEIAAFTALGYGFLRQSIGWDASDITR